MNEGTSSETSEIQSCLEKTTNQRARARKPAFIAATGLATLLTLAAVQFKTPLSSSPALAVTAQDGQLLANMPSFSALVDKVKPSVVSIYVRAQENQKIYAGGQPDQDGAQPFQFFFPPFGGQGFATPEIPAVPQVVKAQGSGFFISSDGYLVTNNHVIANAKKIEIKTIDGTSYPAKLVGTDAKTDIALLKVDAPVQFDYVNLATSLPKVGDWVVAMGNPFGLGGTVTAGIVSAEGRDIGNGPYDDYIQIDAPVNSGNSGGPSFDLHGDVVGINTAIFTPSGGSVGIAFDIPSTTVKKITDELKSNGRVERGWIGVTVQPVTGEIAKSLGLKEASGALIDEPQSGSPAERAGLKSGDVIASIDGTAVKDSRDLARKIGETAPGTMLKLSVLHNGSERSVDLTVKPYPADTTARNETGSEQRPSLGMKLAPSNEVANARADGVVVVGVDPLGAAAEEGVQQGDVIVDVGGKPVTTPIDIRKALHNAQEQGKSSVLFYLKSAAGDHFVALPVKPS